MLRGVALFELLNLDLFLGFRVIHRLADVLPALGGLLGEVVLFAGGLTWLAVLTHSVTQAIRWGLYWFLFAEVIKVMMAAGIAAQWQRRSAAQQ